MEAIVIDNGSGEIKAGFAGEPWPTVRFPNVVGRLKECYRRRTYMDTTTEYNFGSDAIGSRALRKLS